MTAKNVPNDQVRMQATVIDTLVVLLVFLFAYKFDVVIFSHASKSLVYFLLDDPQLIAIKIFYILFVFTPIPFFISNLLFSGSFGQFAMGIRVVTPVSQAPMGVVQSLLKAYLSPIAIFVFCFIPHTIAYHRADRRTLVDLIANTQLLYTGKDKSISKDHPIIAVIMSLFLAYPCLQILSRFSFQSQRVGQHLLIGGTREARSKWLYAYKNPQVFEARKTKTLDKAFTNLTQALESRDKEHLLSQLSIASKLLVKATDDGEDFFAPLPRYINFIKEEIDEGKTNAKIYYQEKQDPEEITYFMTYIKEDGQWKIDLISFIQQREGNPFFENMKEKNLPSMRP